MPDTRLAWLVLAGLLLIATAVPAQERQELSLGDQAAPVTVFADRVENIEKDHLLIAEGRVEIEQGDVRIESDRAEVNTETGEAVATGKVVLFDGRDRLVGERLEYNFRTATGVIYRGEGKAEPHFFFGGARMERFGDKAYRLFTGSFTTCEDDPPSWSVRWGKATAYLDDYVWGTNASFWVWRVPLVPFIPVFGASLRKDRQTGFLTPTFGNSNTKGFFFQQPFYWAISDSQDLVVSPTYFTKRGFGLGADYRYVRTETSRGEISGFYLDDSKPPAQTDENRWIVSIRHDEQITPRMSLKADVARVSDINFLSEFGDSLDERSSQRLESNISLTQRWDKWNLVARLFDYQDLTTTQPIELQRLPEITLNAFQQPIPGAGGLLFQMQSSYDNFVRDIGSEGQRLDIRPQLAYPWSPGGLFTLTPRAGVRETLYDTKVVGTKVDRGFTVEDTRNEFVSRELLEAGADLEARAYRIFDMNGLLGIQRLQHVIEPRVSYSYLTGDDPKDLPQWDGTDSITSSHTVTYSLTNRLKARAAGEGDQPGRVWEVIRFTLSQTYNIEPTQTVTTTIGQPAPTTPTTPTPAGTAATPATASLRRAQTAITPATLPPTGPATTVTTTTTTAKRLSDLTADLILEPVFGIRFRGTASFDPYETTVTSATTDASYDAANWRASFGTRHGQGGDLQFIQGEVAATLGRRWSVRFASNYDVQSGTAIENRVEAEFRAQCWAILGAYIHRSNEDEFHVTVNLLELGQYGFGRAFSSVLQ